MPNASRKQNKPKPSTANKKSKPGPKTPQRKAKSRGKVQTPARGPTRRAQTTFRAVSSAAGAVIGARAKAHVLQSLLPYNATPTRLLDSSQGDVDETAITRNYVYSEFDIATIMRVNPDIPTDIPNCGVLGPTTKIWGDFKTGVPIVSVLDSRLLAIMPSRTLPDQIPRTTTISYSTNVFSNNTQSSPGVFEVIPDNIADGADPGDAQILRPIHNGILWLEPADLTPGYGDIASEAPYGSIHPMLDADTGSRYFWIDANNPENHTEAKQESCSVVEISMTLHNGLGVNTTLIYPLMLVCERLQMTSLNDAPVQYTAAFANSATGVQTFASCQIRQSGYYRVGLSGNAFDSSPDTSIKVFDSVTLTYFLSKLLNIVSKHILNDNIVKNTSITTKTFMTKEQCNAGSMLISNKTPAIAKGGQIYAASLPSNVHWTAYTSDENRVTSSSSATRLKYTGPLAKGAYGWLRNHYPGFRNLNDVYRIGQSSDGILRSYSIQSNSNVRTCNFRGCNVFLLQPPQTYFQGDITTLAHTTFVVQMSVVYEYTSESQIPSLEMTTYDMMAQQQAINILAVTQNFTENPLHLSAMKDVVSRAFNSVGGFYKKNQGAMRGLFSALAAFGGPVASALGFAGSAADALFG